MPTGDVLVVGDLLVDIVVRPAGPLAPGSDTAARIHTARGGSAANTASWLVWLGRSVRLVAAVGDDLLGRYARADLGAVFAGEISTVGATGACVVLVDERGERTMLPDRGVNDALSPATVAAAFEDRPGWLHLSGYTLLHAGSRLAGFAALHGAMAAGIPVSVDASSAAPLRAVGPEEFLRWVDGCQLLFANEEELAVLGGADAALTRVEAVVVKRGGAGATWTDGRTSEYASAVEVEMVDSIGAGDAFAAGFIDAYLGKLCPRDCLQHACTVGATAVASAGASPPARR